MVLAAQLVLVHLAGLKNRVVQHLPGLLWHRNHRVLVHLWDLQDHLDLGHQLHQWDLLFLVAQGFR